ncbi:hypothetical protein Csa_000739 [Cucumis sativus]|nr:hypothetical protein Csa_000739 [Cucumis sativus]
MRPFQPPPATNPPTDRTRRRPHLNLHLPQRDNTSLAVPLPLPPTSSNSAPPPSTSQLHNANRPPDPLPPQRHPFTLSDFERVSRIGSGCGGTVYKVLHRPTGHVYALKVIYGNHEDAVRLQMCREVEILRDVDNPYVVKCHDMFDHNGEIQILSGLAYLHSRRIVHRDIKPSNLLINSRRQVKIADFGVGRILEQTMDPCNSSVGTIAYMSPERINSDLNQGQYNGYAGDIWSFGVSILEFYLGRFPLAVERPGDWASLMCAICMAQPPEAPATASPEFRHFIACCLQREARKRWTAAALLEHAFITRKNGASQYQNKQAHHQNLRQLLPPPPLHPPSLS